MDCANIDLELRAWIRWASEDGNTQSFVRRVAEAAFLACMPDFEMLRPVSVELKRQHPEPEPLPAAPADTELHHWLRWTSKDGNVPSFVGRVVEAASFACADDYALLRPVLVELRKRYPEC